MPPYLTAMWSVMDQLNDVATAIDSIVRQEMLHMGLACNVMNALKAPAGGPKVSPKIAFSGVIPNYPDHLPGEVLPDLVVPLEKLSKQLVLDKFMAIEKPEYEPLAFAYNGQPYPTIGAFYDAVSDALLALDSNAFESVPRRQRSAAVGLVPVTSQIEALRAISLIKKQGEGTAVGPYFDPDDSSSVAHYFRFGEIYHEHRVKVVDYRIEFTGTALHFPLEGAIYPMAPVPQGGYHTADADRFNQTFSNLLRNLEAAWSLDDDAQANAKLSAAIGNMYALPDIASALMSTKISPPHPETYGPGFVYIP
jgi:hypothetical protein